MITPGQAEDPAGATLDPARVAMNRRQLRRASLRTKPYDILEEVRRRRLDDDPEKMREQRETVEQPRIHFWSALRTET